jgi:hypothetical protein
MFRIRIWIRIDPHSVWAWIRDPDPRSGSRCLKIGKKPKFPMSNSICNPLTTRTEKCYNWVEILTTVPTVQELLILGNSFLYLAPLNSYRVECKLISKSYTPFWQGSVSGIQDPGSKIRIQDPDPGSVPGIPRIRIEILGWIRIRIKRMRIQNTALLPQMVVALNFNKYDQLYF